MRATLMIRDNPLYNLFMSPKLYNYAFVAHHEHYPILANSCFSLQMGLCRSSLRVCESAIKERKGTTEGQAAAAQWQEMANKEAGPPEKGIMDNIGQRRLEACTAGAHKGPRSSSRCSGVSYSIPRSSASWTASGGDNGSEASAQKLS